MAKKPETVFKEKVASFLKTLPNCFYEKVQQVAIVGSLDFTIVVSGIPILMELKKSSKDKLSAIQQHKAEKWQRCGALVIEACPENWDRVRTLLEEISRQKFKPWSVVCLK